MKKLIIYIATILLTIFLCITVLRPFMAEVYWFRGYREIKRENWNRAIEIYELASRWDSYKGGLYYDLGKIYMEKKDYDTALEYIKECKKYIDYPSLPQNLAFVYFNLGDRDNAITELKRAIAYQRNVEQMNRLQNILNNLAGSPK